MIQFERLAWSPVLATLMLWIGSTAFAAEQLSRNLLRNSGFEQGQIYWETIHAEQGASSVEQEGSNYFLRLAPLNSTYPHLFAMQQAVENPPMGRYLLRARIRVGETYAGRLPHISVNIYRQENRQSVHHSNKHAMLWPEAPVGQWLTLIEPVEVPENASRLWVQLFTFGGVGYADFDDVELIPASEHDDAKEPARNVPTRLSWTWAAQEYPEWLKQFRDAGFTAVVATLPAKQSYWEQPETLRVLYPQIKAAAEAGLDVYTQMYMGSDPTSKLAQRTGHHAVTRRGTVEPHLLCPVSDAMWQEYLTPATVTVAKLAMEHPAIRGLLLDTEQYAGTETSGAVSDIYCFCDACMARFGEVQHISVPDLKPEERAAWLEQQNLLEPYYQLLEQRLEAQAEAMARQVQQVNPRFELHFYLIDDSWFYRGLLRGWGVLDKPLLIFDGSTYYGYLPRKAEQMEQYLAKLNPRAVWSPGFWTHPLSARALGLNLQRVVEEDRPFWIYNQIRPYPTWVLQTVKSVLTQQ